MRTAYVVVKDPAVQNAMLTALRAITLMASPLATALATQWILDGAAKTLLDGIRGGGGRAAADRQTMVGGLRCRSCLGHSYLASIAELLDIGRLHPHRALGRSPRDGRRRLCGRAVRARCHPDFTRGVAERGQLSLALKKLSGLLARRPARAMRFRSFETSAQSTRSVPTAERKGMKSVDKPMRLPYRPQGERALQFVPVQARRFHVNSDGDDDCRFRLRIQFRSLLACRRTSGLRSISRRNSPPG